MPANEVICNLTLAATGVSPMNFGEIWLTRNNVFTEDELRGQRIATPLFAVTETQRIQLAINPGQFQFSWKGTNPDTDALRRAMTNLINGIPRTIPLLAVGFNFVWNIEPLAGGLPLAEFSRERFRNLGPFDTAVRGGEATWGSAVTRPAFGGGLVLNVLPMFADLDSAKPAQHLQAQFNYQFMVQNAANPTDAALIALGHANEAHEEASRVAHSILD